MKTQNNKRTSVFFAFGAIVLSLFIGQNSFAEKDIAVVTGCKYVGGSEIGCVILGNIGVTGCLYDGTSSSCGVEIPVVPQPID